MAASSFAKLLTWVIRVFQLIFAIILVGILSYMIHEYRQFGYRPLREVIVPEIFSVLAIFVSVFSIAAVCFLGYTLQLVAAFLDFVIWVGYLASAGLLRHNYHVRSYKNPLRNSLMYIRTSRGYSDREHRTNGLVKLLAALVLIQIFLFFFTTLLSVYVARKHGEERVVREKTRTTHQVV